MNLREIGELFLSEVRAIRKLLEEIRDSLKKTKVG